MYSNGQYYSQSRMLYDGGLGLGDWDLMGLVTKAIEVNKIMTLKANAQPLYKSIALAYKVCTIYGGIKIIFRFTNSSMKRRIKKESKLKLIKTGELYYVEY